MATNNHVFVLKGASTRGSLELGSEIGLRNFAGGVYYNPLNHDFMGPAYDSKTTAVYLIVGESILRLDGMMVTIVAGHARERGYVDGPGSSARFNDLHCLTPDGKGVLYASDLHLVRKVTLALEEGDEAVVTTLPAQLPDAIEGMAYDPRTNSLIAATATALYRVGLGPGAAGEPVLLAGREGNRRILDGSGADARFRYIRAVLLDGEGRLLVLDRHGGRSMSSIRMVVAADGTTTTVAADLEGDFVYPAVLPNGYLAMGSSEHLLIMDLGLTPPSLAAVATAEAAPPAAAGPVSGPAGLAADLGALLDAQPDGSSDVTVLVGDRSFPAHRALLSARSPYFRQRLVSGMADSSGQQLSLPDADPDAYECCARFMYTGAADIPPERVQAVAELADRLELLALCRDAQALVLESVAAETVVGVLLWAAERVEAGVLGFAQLLDGLKAWYQEHEEEVVAQAADSLILLMGKAPKLAFDLQNTRKRPRGV